MAQSHTSGRSARGPPEDSVLDDILTPMERNVKTYLVNAMSADLIELLALLAVERPEDPHFWLGVRLLERSPNGPYIAHKRSELVRRKPQPAAAAGGGGGAAPAPPAAAAAQVEGGGAGGAEEGEGGEGEGEPTADERAAAEAALLAEAGAED